MIVNSILFAPVHPVRISHSQGTLEMYWASHVLDWPAIAGVAGVIAALAIFVRDMLTIQKLRAEIRALKNAEKAKTEVIQIATLDEIERYTQRYPRHLLHAFSPRLWESVVEGFGSVLLFGLLISGPAFAICFLQPILGLSSVVADVFGAVGLFGIVFTGTRMLIDGTVTRARYGVLDAELDSALDAA